MKIFFYCFAFLILTVNFVTAQPSDTLIVKTKRVKGFGPFMRGSAPLSTLDKSNPWYKAIPNIKGIPDSLDQFAFYSHDLDFLQHTYQSYLLGIIPKELFISTKNALSPHISINSLSKEFIKVSIAIAAGVDKYGNMIVVADRNNNYNLSDDKLVTIAPILAGQNYWGRYHDGLPIEVEYEYYNVTEIKKERVWIYIDYDSEYYNAGALSSKKSIELGIVIAEHQIGAIKIENEEYQIALNNRIRAVYRDDAAIKILKKEGSNQYKPVAKGARINKGGTFQLGSYYYTFEDVSLDGSHITLIKNKAVAEKGGNQVGQKAVDFTSKTVMGEKISLSSYLGKFVYLEFWGTWCSPCIKEIPTLLEINEKYSGKNFEIIGIAKEEVGGENKLREFIKDKGMSWPQIAQIENGEIIGLYAVRSYPTSFLIDPDGKILKKNIRADELKNILEEILKN